MTKENGQQESFARICLKEALLLLAEEKDYKDISVTELCRKAGVSRMAFYRNYRVVNDIFFEIANDLNNEVVTALGSPFRMNTTREWYVGVFELIGNHQATMRLMFQENFQYQWMKTVNGFAVHDEGFSSGKRYQRLMWSGGFENAVNYWLNSGMKESPEEMAEYCITYLPHLWKRLD